MPLGNYAERAKEMFRCTPHPVSSDPFLHATFVFFTSRSDSSPAHAFSGLLLSADMWRKMREPGRIEVSFNFMLMEKEIILGHRYVVSW